MALGSDVPLEKDILRRPEEFIKTWVEWSADNRTQIIQGSSNSGSTTSVVFVVPNNNTLYITNLFLSGSSTGGSTGFFTSLIINDIKYFVHISYSPFGKFYFILIFFIIFLSYPEKYSIKSYCIIIFIQ